MMPTQPSSWTAQHAQCQAESVPRNHGTTTHTPCKRLPPTKTKCSGAQLPRQKLGDNGHRFRESARQQSEEAAVHTPSTHWPCHQFQTQSPPPQEHSSAGSVKTTSFVMGLTTSREGALGIRGALEQTSDGPVQAMGAPGPATPAVITPSTRTPVTHNFHLSLTPNTHTGHT